MSYRVGDGTIVSRTVFVALLTVLLSAHVVEAEPFPRALEGPRLNESGLTGYRTAVALPEVRLVDSQGRDQVLPLLLQHRVVVVNFVFTSCQTFCPAGSALLRACEIRLGDRMGKDVVMVSISVDPEHDTPDALRAHAAKLGAGPDWYWLTGSFNEVSRALQGFGVPLGRRIDDHPPVVLVGMPDADLWFRWVGLPSPDALVQAVEWLLDAREGQKLPSAAHSE